MKRALPALLLGFVVGLSAGCAKPVPLRREGFSLTIPARWHLVTKDKEYQPDHHFSILAPPETPAHAIFSIYDETLVPKTRIDLIAEKILEKHRDAQRSRFTHWGRYDGEGVDLRYPSEGHIMQMRFFAWSGAARCFVAIEVGLVDQEAELRPARELLASSFEIVDRR